MSRVSPRAWLAAIAITTAAALAVAATRGLSDASVYYRTPSEVVRRGTGDDVVRVGGTVVPGTVRFDRRRGLLTFMLSDGRTRLAVANRGAPPKLFRAGEEALVEGRITAGVLRSADVIVKHDEEYRAPEKERAEP